MKVYSVKKYEEAINWEAITPLTIENYPWYEGGLKQNTEVKLAVHNDVLHLNVLAHDIHSSAHVLDYNGSVYLDSCFEFFFRPENAENNHYINLEINCIGTVYLAIRKGDGKRRAEAGEIEQITVIPTLQKGVEKKPMDNDEQWGLSIAIPFSFLEKFYGSVASDVWYANFYRCGGDIDDQYATWNNVVTPQPDFHQPRQFGRLEFVK